MEPKIEDVLFLDSYCQHLQHNANKVFQKTTKHGDDSMDVTCPEIKINTEIFKNLIKEELKGKYYPGFVKYFKHNAKECTLKSAKNPLKSAEARIQGNALFSKKEHNTDIHKEIWKLYSKSVALAPAGSKELVLAYECRSNILLHFKKYEECIQDIDRALFLTEFDLLKVKLLCRKMTCFAAINKDVVEKERLWETLKCHFEKIGSPLKDEKFTKMIEQAKNDALIQPIIETVNKPESFSSITTLANMTLMLNKERHLIADRDYEVGEAIIVTKPTITSVNPDKLYAYCSHCLSFTWAGIPCDECSLCMYCSEECKVEAWKKYHVLECKVNPHIDFAYSIYYKLKNSIKIFMSGVTEFGSIPKLLQKLQEVELLKDDPNLTKREKFFDSEFLNYYSLPYKPYTDSCSLTKSVKNTCFLMAYLTQISGHIFEKDVVSIKGKDLAKDEDFVNATLVLLKIMLLCKLYLNYPVINNKPKCPNYDDSDDCRDNRCCHVGKIFHFFKGIMEKSCNPNLSVCNSLDGKIIYYCIQPIKKMETITVPQIFPFFHHSMLERHQMKPTVPSIHEFCQCTACLKDWPPVMTTEEFRKLQIKFERRLSKVKTKGTEIIMKYIARSNDCKGDYKKFFIFDAEEFQELARDTNAVISTCGQPSVASCWLITIFCCVFKRFYGDTSLQSRLPKDC